jgi:hypothetical protein
MMNNTSDAAHTTTTTAAGASTRLKVRRLESSSAVRQPPPPIIEDDEELTLPEPRRRKAWPPTQTRLFVRRLNVGEVIKVQWCHPTTCMETESWMGTVTEVRVGVNSDVKVDFGPVHGVSIFPPDTKDKAVSSIFIVSRHQHHIANLPPLAASALLIPPSVPRIIFADGGHYASGVAASAFTVHQGEPFTEVPDEWHSKFYLHANVNVVELTALVAALQYCVSNPMSTLIIVDSFNAYSYVLGTSVARLPILKELSDKGKALLARTNGQVILARMLRENDNKADCKVKLTMDSQVSHGRQELFTNLPVPARARPAPPQPVAVPTPSTRDIARTIQSCDDFIAIRRLKTRTRCPQPAVATWASLVKETLAKFNSPPAPGDQRDAALAFLLLPTAFLPVAAARKRVVEHIQSARPFSLNLKNHPPVDAADASAGASAAPVPRPEIDPSVRLGRTVERLARSRKLRSAVKILRQDSLSPDTTFEEKFDTLQEKFLRRRQPIPDLPTVPMVPYVGETVRKVLLKMSRNAATCIDGWTKDLMVQAIAVDPSILDDLGHFCLAVNCGLLDPDVMDIIRMGRLVAVPKPDGKVRPIVISSFIAKLAGLLALKVSDPKCSALQYAIGTVRGAERVVHLAREAYNNNMAIIRLDSINAFNVAPRAVIAEVLRDSGESNELCHYFNALYRPTSKLVVYGPNNSHRVVLSEEGVRQGDAASAYFFCKVMDIACHKIAELHPEAKLWCYMDDLTIACPPHMVDELVCTAVRQLKAVGFSINMDKSAAIVQQHLPTPPRQIKLIPPTEQFIMLGACLTSVVDGFIREKADANLKFFHQLFSCLLHPQLQWTILRLCGTPKMIYLASTMPPALCMPLLQDFDKLVQKAAAQILQCSTVNTDYLHNKLGGGFPLYSACAAQLYESSVLLAHSARDSKGSEVVLVTDSLLPSADLCSQGDAQYLYYTHSTHFSTLTPLEFRMAAAIRLRTLPDAMMPTPITCACAAETVCSTPVELIEHALRCPRMSRYTTTTRHNEVRDAICGVARSYGITVTKEPTFYEYHDESGARRRPDLTFHISPAITTDVTIVHPEGAPGNAAKKAAARKKEIHTQAANRMSHVFIPFALETYGHQDESCLTLSRRLEEHLPRYLQMAFRFDLFHAVSSTLARSRACMVISALGRDDSDRLTAFLTAASHFV